MFSLLRYIKARAAFFILSHPTLFRFSVRLVSLAERTRDLLLRRISPPPQTLLSENLSRLEQRISAMIRRGEPAEKLTVIRDIVLEVRNSMSATVTRLETLGPIHPLVREKIDAHRASVDFLDSQIERLSRRVAQQLEAAPSSPVA